MRKAIVLFTCIFLACGAQAQWYITPEAGVNNSIFKTDASTNQVLTSSIAGFQAGALVTKSWSGTKSVLDYIFLQSGLEFAQKGTYRSRGSQSVYGPNSTIRLMYLEAPLNAGIHVKLSHDVEILASAGLYLAYGISGTDKGSTQDISGSSQVDRKVNFTNTDVASNERTSIKPFDNGYNFSAGITYRNFLLKANYSLGIGTVSPVTSSIRYQNEVWNFSVGYSIRLKKK